MRFLRRNKYVIVSIVILIVLVVLGMQVKSIFVPDEGKASYGNRLEGIKDNEIKDEVYKNIEDSLKADQRVLGVEHLLHGKIIDLIITVSDDVSVSDAKNFANSTVDKFTNNELNFYSLQVFVKKNNKDLKDFPIIGYKGTDTTGLIFTKDRAAS